MLLIPWYAKHLMKSNKKISVGGFVHGLLIRGDAEFKNYTQTSHFGYHMRGGGKVLIPQRLEENDIVVRKDLIINLWLYGI